MSKAFYKIEDFIDTTSSAFALKGTSPLSVGASEVTMCSSANVLAEIEDNFSERSIYIKETETPMTSFAAMWTRWISRRGDRLAASWEALHTKYKPLENYDRYEAGKDTRTITPAETTTTTTPAETTMTITPAETTNTSSPAETTNTETIVSPGAVTTDDSSIYAFNSSAAVPVTSNTRTENRETTNALTLQTAGTDVLTVQEPETQAMTVQQAGTEAVTVQEPETDEVEYGKHVYGNIGVTSAMDLIRQEMEIDETDFVYKAICEFINLYTVYV